MDQSISTKLGFKQVEDLGTYGFLIDKVRAKLSGWDARKLSMAGRVTLARSVLLTILIYFLSSTLISISICKEIEKFVRAFIWEFLF